MLRFKIFTAAALIFCLQAFSQDFVWMTGSNNVNTASYAVYGTVGVPSSSSLPGSKSFAGTWHDNAGNLWMFGGDGYAGSSSGQNSDLWKYNTLSNQWTWMGGSTVAAQPGVYGTQGVSSATVWPGGRSEAQTWVDAAGDLWMYGGNGLGSSPTAFGYLGDLWKYNIASGQWTWVNGSNAVYPAPVYGTMGVPSVSNTPGARETSVTWTDASGNLWLFGGQSDIGTVRNDLWKYDIGTNQWTWIMGSNSWGQTGSYGTQNVASANNMPGGRRYLQCCTDNQGNVYLFGGEGVDASGNVGKLNDLWKFNIPTLQWTWVSGGNSANQFGTYGTQGLASTSNAPGGRQSYCLWSDVQGNLWLFGGVGYATSGSLSWMNDFWKFNIAGNSWTWLEGANSGSQYGSYGIQGVPAPSNVPCSKAQTLRWTDNSGNLWLYGGYSTFGLGNDLWEYTLCSSGPPSPLISSQLLVCSGNSATLSASGTGTISWYSSPGSTLALATGSSYITPVLSAGVTYYAQSNTCSSSLTRTAVSLTVSPTPSITAVATHTAICLGGSTSLTAGGATAYTWQPINSNAAQVSVSPTISITYSVIGTTAGNCFGSALVHVDVNTLSLSAVSATPAICSGDHTSLSANGAAVYTWQPGNFSGFLVTVSPTVTTTYTVYGTDANGCNGLGSVPVQVNPLPGVIVTGTAQVICAGETTTLTVSGAAVYAWSNGATGTSISVSPTTNILYTVTGTDGNGCSNAAAITQSVSTCTGIQSYVTTGNALLVYPNPSYGCFAVKASRNITLSLSNQLGQVIKTIELTAGADHSAEIGNLSEGIYFLSGEGISSKKIIVIN